MQTHPNQPSKSELMSESMSEKNGMTSAMTNAATHVAPTMAAHAAQPTSVFECRCFELRNSRKNTNRALTLYVRRQHTSARIVSRAGRTE